MDDDCDPADFDALCVLNESVADGVRAVTLGEAACVFVCVRRDRESVGLRVGAMYVSLSDRRSESVSETVNDPTEGVRVRDPCDSLPV